MRLDVLLGARGVASRRARCCSGRCSEYESFRAVVSLEGVASGTIEWCSGGPDEVGHVS